MRIHVTDRDGERHELEVPPDSVLMETLRLPDYGVAAICGGLMACATCHVYVADQDRERLPPPSLDETALLEGLASVRPASRLSCQIVVTAALDGLSVTVAPEE